MKSIAYTSPTLYIQLDMSKVRQRTKDMFHITSAVVLTILYFILFSV